MDVIVWIGWKDADKGGLQESWIKGKTWPSMKRRTPGGSIPSPATI